MKKELNIEEMKNAAGGAGEENLALLFLGPLGVVAYFVVDAAVDDGDDS